MAAAGWVVIAPGGKILAEFPTRAEAETHKKTLDAEGWNTEVRKHE
jgi:hypothetical protein